MSKNTEHRFATLEAVGHAIATPAPLERLLDLVLDLSLQAEPAEAATPGPVEGDTDGRIAGVGVGSFSLRRFSAIAPPATARTRIAAAPIAGPSQRLGRDEVSAPLSQAEGVDKGSASPGWVGGEPETVGETIRRSVGPAVGVSSPARA